MPVYHAGTSFVSEFHISTCPYIWTTGRSKFDLLQRQDNFCEILSSHGGEYEVQICLLGCTTM
jgi:hypothetical protein